MDGVPYSALPNRNGHIILHKFPDPPHVNSFYWDNDGILLCVISSTSCLGLRLCGCEIRTSRRGFPVTFAPPQRFRNGRISFFKLNMHATNSARWRITESIPFRRFYGNVLQWNILSAFSMTGKVRVSIVNAREILCSNRKEYFLRYFSRARRCWTRLRLCRFTRIKGTRTDGKCVLMKKLQFTEVYRVL